MDIRQLTYFLAILEEGNISKAAEKLHIAQPPLSQQLKLLENELGIKLIERNTRKFEVTDAGQMVGYRAKQIIQLVETLIKEAQDISKGLKGTLSIGTVSSAGATLLPELIYSFHKKYPDINFQILDEDTYKIIELLNNGIIDIGIIRTPFNLNTFNSINLPEDSMVVVCNQPFNDNSKNSLCLSDLKNQPLLIQQRYEKIIIELCYEAGFHPRILCKSNDVRTILLWVNTGLGIAIVPKNCMGLIPGINLYYKELNEPALKAGTAIIWPKNKYLSSVANHFIESFNFQP